MNKTEIALNYVKENGPVLPVRISKAINTNILMASAILAELVSLNKVKLTHQNIGSSPLYYMGGQEIKLESALENQIKGKRREALELIKEKRVIQESDLEPSIRVAIGEIKDFATLLKVTFNNQTHTFWKWHLTTNEEVKSIINSIFKPVPPKPEEPQKVIQPKPIQTVQQKEPEIKETPKPEIPQETKEVIGFYKEIDDYFKENKVKILKEEIVKRDREFNFIIAISSNLGELKYFVKVKNKKKTSDADLSLAYSQAQMENLPLLYLTNGEITRKAQKLIELNLKGIVYKKV